MLQHVPTAGWEHCMSVAVWSEARDFYGKLAWYGCYFCHFERKRASFVIATKKRVISAKDSEKGVRPVLKCWSLTKGRQCQVSDCGIENQMLQF